MAMFFVRWNLLSIWVFPENNGKPPQIIHLFIGFSMIFTIHFLGVNTPIFGLTPICKVKVNNGNLATPKSSQELDPKAMLELAISKLPWDI